MISVNVPSQVRCERASAVLKAEVKDVEVAQLQGGIHRFSLTAAAAAAAAAAASSYNTQHADI